jgi:hypothetical protein
MIKILLNLVLSKIKAINWKKVAPYIVIAILAILLLFNFLHTKNIKNERDRYYGNFVQTDKDYQDAKGKWVKESSALTITIKELETLIENRNVALQNKLEIIKAMGIKIKNLESMGSSAFVIHDTILIPFYLASPDTSIGNYNFTDGYFTMNLTTCEFGTKMIYDYQDTLTWAANVYFKDKWRFKNIFKPRNKYIKLNSQLANTKARITAQEFYKIKGRIKRLVE